MASNTLEPWSLEQISARVQSRTTHDKGRCLYTRVPLAPGDVVFVEGPLFSSLPKDHPDLWATLTSAAGDLPTRTGRSALELPASWHLAALVSTLNTNYRLRERMYDKWSPSTDSNTLDCDYILQYVAEGEGDAGDLRALREGCESGPEGRALLLKTYCRLLSIWRYNSFGHFSEGEGLVMYDTVSLMSHSCEASCCWHYGSGESFVLRARAHLQPGDELSISYINDEDLSKSTDQRRLKLSGWLFTCNCTRCQRDLDLCRGFLCPRCQYGSCFFSQEQGALAPCNACASPPAEHLVGKSRFFFLKYRHGHQF